MRHEHRDNDMRRVWGRIGSRHGPNERWKFSSRRKMSGRTRYGEVTHVLWPGYGVRHTLSGGVLQERNLALSTKVIPWQKKTEQSR